MRGKMQERIGSVVKSKTKVVTKKDKTGHTHNGIVDSDGNGITSTTSGGPEHTHKIFEWSVQPAKGHTHKI